MRAKAAAVRFCPMEPEEGAAFFMPDNDAMDTAGAAGIPSLRGSVASGVRWGTFDQVTQTAVRLGAAVALTRLLDPVDFGLMSLAGVVLGLARAITGLGLGEALVQHKDLQPRHVSTAFVTSMLGGLVLAAAVGLSAGPAARFFSQTQLWPVLVVLSATVLIQGLERTPNDLLARALSFRRFYLSSTIAAGAGAIVGIAVAAADQGVWALVAMALSEAIVAAGLGWFFAIRTGIWRPSVRFEWRTLRELSGFSSFVTADRALGFALDNGDNLLIGRMLGTAALGYYSLAYRVILVPMQRVAKVITTSAFPALTRVQADPERLRDGFLQANRYVALTCMPIMIGTAVTADTLVPVLFGEPWRPASTSLQLLALSGPALLVTVLSGSLYRAVGRPELGLLRTAVSVGVYLPAFLIGSAFGINGVAAGLAIASYLVLPLDLRLSARAVNVRVSRLLINVAPAAVTTLLMAVVATGIGIALRGTGDALRLAAMITGGAVAYGAGALLLLGATLKEALRDLTGRRA